ncbi:MAG: NfeD family protein, partial [Rikenellaceae bacterium]|nr:NfeD family protein [Rikenellaceae bacterium]
MDAWMIWAIAVFVLAVLKIFTPGFFVLCLSFGALCAVLAAALGFGLAGQLAFFAVGSTLAFIFVRPVMVKYFLKKDPVKTGIEARVGRTVRVTEAIDTLIHRGGE